MREFYRAARVYRELWMICQSLRYALAIAPQGNVVYLTGQNATILTPVLASVGTPCLGPIHTSEFGYTFGNSSHYNVNGNPFNPPAENSRSEQEEAGSLAAFTSVGQPSLYTKKTLQEFSVQHFLRLTRQLSLWLEGIAKDCRSLMNRMLSPALAAQELGSCCSFINSPVIIAQLQY